MNALDFTPARHAALSDVARAIVTRRACPDARNRFGWFVNGREATSRQAEALTELMHRGLILPKGSHPTYLMAITDRRGAETLSAWSRRVR